MGVPIPPATVSAPPDTIAAPLPPFSQREHAPYIGGMFWHAPMYYARPMNVGVGIVVLVLLVLVLAAWRKPK